MLINYKKPNIRGIGPITLKPGINDVDADLWASVQKDYHVGIKRMIDADLLEIVEDAKGDPIESADVSKLNEKKAVALVKETVDELLLMQWHEADKRKPVLEAIEKQLDKLAKAGEPAKGK